MYISDVISSFKLCLILFPFILNILHLKHFYFKVPVRTILRKWNKNLIIYIWSVVWHIFESFEKAFSTRSRFIIDFIQIFSNVLSYGLSNDNFSGVDRGVSKQRFAYSTNSGDKMVSLCSLGLKDAPFNYHNDSYEFKLQSDNFSQPRGTV